MSDYKGDDAGSFGGPPLPWNQMLPVTLDLNNDHAYALSFVLGEEDVSQEFFVDGTNVAVRENK